MAAPEPDPAHGAPPTTRRGWLVPLAIFVLALGVRLIYFAQVADMPFVQVPIVDARAYDEWAQRIVEQGGIGDRVFYQAPLYPYLLAGFYALFGRDLVWVHVLQMALGAVSCVITYFGTRTLLGQACGVVAGVMLALYAPAIFFDGLIGKAGLGLCLWSAVLALLLRHQARDSWPRCAWAGLLLGLLCLTRENALALVPAVPVWLWLRFGERSPAQRARALLAFGLAVAAVLVTVGLRNLAVGDTFALTTSQMGPNFYMGNNEQASGLYVPLVPGRHTPIHEAPDAQRIAERELGRPLTRGEVSDYWMERGLRFVREHPGRFVLLFLRKIALTWNAQEIADVEDMHVYAEWSGLLRGLHRIWHFGLLVPLAAAGVVLLWPRRRDLWLLGWLALVYTLSVALFITFARFRLPLVPLLLPLAAAGVVRAAGQLWAGRPRALLGPAAAFLAAAAAVNVPLLDAERLRLASYANLGGIMLNADRTHEAEPWLLRAMAIESENADLRFHMGVLRYKQGRPEEAAQHLLRMAALEPDDVRAPRLLARIYADLGREREARAWRRRARRLDPARGGAAPGAAPREAGP